MRTSKKLLILSSVMVVISCGSTEPAKRTNAGGSATCLKVVNGKTTSSYKAINLIVYGQGSGIFTCTGTFVSHNTMITAAHCVPEKSGETLTYIPGNEVNLGQTTSESEAVLRTGTEALTYIRGNIKTEEGDRISTIESVKDLAIVIFPDNTAPDVMKVRKNNIAGGESVRIVGFGDTLINDPKSNSIRTKRLGRNQVVKNANLKSQLPDLWILGGKGSGQVTDGSADYSLAAQGDSGGPLIYDDSIVGIASAAGPVPQDVDDDENPIGFNAIIDSEAMNIYASLHSDFAKALMNKAIEQGALIEYSDGSEIGESNEDNTDSIQQSRSTNEVADNNNCT